MPNVLFIQMLFVYLHHRNKQIEIMKTLIKLVNGKEVARKTGYANLESATNAGNSWTRDCAIHAEIRKNRTFIVE